MVDPVHDIDDQIPSVVVVQDWHLNPSLPRLGAALDVLWHQRLHHLLPSNRGSYARLTGNGFRSW